MFVFAILLKIYKNIFFFAKKYLDGCAACLGLLYDTFNHNGWSVTGVLYFTYSLSVTANVIDEDDHKGSGHTSP